MLILTFDNNGEEFTFENRCPQTHKEAVELIAEGGAFLRAIEVDGTKAFDATEIILNELLDDFIKNDWCGKLTDLLAPVHHAWADKWEPIARDENERAGAEWEAHIKSESLPDIFA